MHVVLPFCCVSQPCDEFYHLTSEDARVLFCPRVLKCYHVTNVTTFINDISVKGGRDAYLILGLKTCNDRFLIDQCYQMSSLWLGQGPRRPRPTQRGFGHLDGRGAAVWA